MVILSWGVNMYKEFKESKPIEFSEIKNNLNFKLMFLYDEDNTQSLMVIKKYINDEYSIDEYDMIYDRFSLIKQGKERFCAEELLGRLIYKENWKVSVFGE